MALSFGPVRNPTLTGVGNGNGSIQGGNASPQPAAPSTTVQNPNYNPQPAAPGKVIQNTSNSQAAATTAAIAAAVAQAQAQAQVAAAKAKEILRIQVQGQVNSKVTAQTQKLAAAVASPRFQGSLKISKKTPNIKIVTDKPANAEEYSAAYNKALQDFYKKSQPGKQNGWQKVWDKATFGQDRRDVAARSYAQEQAQKIMERDFPKYEASVNAYLKKQAAAQAAVNKAATTMTQAEYDKFVASEQAKLEKEYKSLTQQATYFDATTAAYGDASGRKLTSFASKAVSGVAKLASDQNPIWRATLGGGWENVPSVVTAPSRAINFVGNINTKDRQINQYGGTSIDRSKTGKNAWQATLNQRNFNIRPVVDQKYNKDQAFKLLKDFRPNGDIVTSNFVSKFNAAKSDAEKDKVARAFWDSKNKSARFKNSAQELAADPLLGLGKVADAAKGIGFVSKASSKLAAAGTKFTSKLQENKVVNWLGKEHVTVQGRRQAFVDQELDDMWQKKPAVRKIITFWQENKNSIKAGEKSRIMRGVVDDLSTLKGKEIDAFQTYFTGKHWNFKGADALSEAQKSNIVRLADKYQAHYDNLQKLENKASIATPYRKNYLPQYGGKWSVSVAKVKKKLGMGDDGLWFTKQREGWRRQNRKQLVNSMSARQYHSAAARKDLPYLRDLVGGVEDLGRNIDRIQNVKNTVKATKWEKAMHVAGTPMRAWKKAVLLGNPAWYVNNELFNQMSGVMEGGLSFLKNQRKTGKYLQHMDTNFKARYAPSIARKMTSEIGSNVSKEVGSGRLARMATKQENRARVSLYRTMRQKGLSHDDAVKHLNRALFSYDTKNWERPIKTLIPFYHWQKNISKRAASLSFTNPKSAIGFNRTDRYQQDEYNRDFDTVVPQLKKLGYSDSEIATFRKDNAKYFKGRLKVGNKYISTPFNAFSDRGLSNLGINPFIAAGKEVATATDNFGRDIKGKDASFTRRLLSKFPQFELGRQFKLSHDVSSGKLKPSIKYIGKEGHDGYGLGKEKQGYDSSKPNYVPSMDPRKDLKKNVLAFGGVPRSMEFDKPAFVKGKALQKLTGEYFALDTSKMDFDAAEAARQKIFKKYGVSSDEFYKGILAKYDSDNTKNIKQLKEDAASKNKQLFEEYGRQPEGTRNVWVTKKLRELASNGYFDDNPFLKSFKYASPTSVAKADKQIIVQEAVKTGNWSKYRAKYGLSQKQIDFEAAQKSGNWDSYTSKYGKSAKAQARDQAVASGDWSSYKANYGTTEKQSPYQFEGKFFKSADSMKKYKDGAFWAKYAAADKSGKAKLLADNSQYNERAGWTTAQWLAQKRADKLELKGKASGFGNIDTYIAKNIANTNVKATRFQSTLHRRTKKVAYR